MAYKKFLQAKQKHVGKQVLDTFEDEDKENKPLKKKVVDGTGSSPIKESVRVQKSTELPVIKNFNPIDFNHDEFLFDEYSDSDEIMKKQCGFIDERDEGGLLRLSASTFHPKGGKFSKPEEQELLSLHLRSKNPTPLGSVANESMFDTEMVRIYSSGEYLDILKKIILSMSFEHQQELYLNLVE